MAVEVFKGRERSKNPDGSYYTNSSHFIDVFENWDDAIEFAKNYTTDRVLSLWSSDMDIGVLVRDEDTGREELVLGDEDEARRRQDAKEQEKQTRINGILRAAEEGGRVELNIVSYSGRAAESGCLKHVDKTQRFFLWYDGRREELEVGECCHRLHKFNSVEIASS